MRDRVSHVEDNHMGIESTGIDIESITHLRRMLELNMGDSRILNRELAALDHD